MFVSFRWGKGTKVTSELECEHLNSATDLVPDQQKTKLIGSAWSLQKHGLLSIR